MKSIIFNQNLYSFPMRVELHFYDCGGIFIILWSNYFQFQLLDYYIQQFVFQHVNRKSNPRFHVTVTSKHTVNISLSYISIECKVGLNFVCIMVENRKRLRKTILSQFSVHNPAYSPLGKVIKLRSVCLNQFKRCLVSSTPLNQPVTIT